MPDGFIWLWRLTQRVLGNSGWVSRLRIPFHFIRATLASTSCHLAFSWNGNKPTIIDLEVLANGAACHEASVQALEYRDQRFGLSC